ncbi:MAG TPA: hydrogenase maturation protease [Firmicutes bacterium]|nr:hydrogenase maturation protease [Bacillota bacterium]
MKSIKIIGCGNILAFDEGVGIHIVRRLRREILPEWVVIEELGNPGQMSAQLVAGTDKLIVIDAYLGEFGQQGFIRRHFPQDTDLVNIFSQTIHAQHLSSIFEMKEEAFPGKIPQEITFFGVKIEERNKFGVGLSYEVFASLQGVINAILQELY